MKKFIILALLITLVLAMSGCLKQEYIVKENGVADVKIVVDITKQIEMAKQNDPSFVYQETNLCEGENMQYKETLKNFKCEQKGMTATITGQFDFNNKGFTKNADGSITLDLANKDANLFAGYDQGEDMFGQVPDENKAEAMKQMKDAGYYAEISFIMPSEIVSAGAGKIDPSNNKKVVFDMIELMFRKSEMKSDSFVIKTKPVAAAQVVAEQPIVAEKKIDANADANKPVDVNGAAKVSCGPQLILLLGLAGVGVLLFKK